MIKRKSAVISEQSVEFQFPLSMRVLQGVDLFLPSMKLPLSRLGKFMYPQIPIQVGDWVDFKDLTSEDTAYQGWFEGRIVDIIEYSSDDNPDNSEVLYEVQHRRSATEAPIFVTLNELRPISRVNLKPADLDEGDTVLANFNTMDPSKRGYWYDFIITEMDRTSARPIIHGTIIAEPVVLEKCVMMYPNELMKIEPIKLVSERTKHERKIMQTEPTSKRYCAAACFSCMDLPGRKCRQCGCAVCFSKKEPEKQLICDECQNYFHVYCLKKPLTELPEGDWFCDSCQSSHKRTPSKIKTEPKEADSEKLPNSGRGGVEEDGDVSNNSRGEEVLLTCGKSPEKLQFGPIPGVEVGTTWRFKSLLLNCGVHLSMAPVHSRKLLGVFSVLLDKDFGKIQDKGDDLVFSLPDEASRMKVIRSFASNCLVPFNADKQVAPSNWKAGKPIRIVRSHQLGTSFSPKLGFRYDGIYKVVKYNREISKAKRFWHFHLRRDDDTPAPWTEKGKKRISALSLGRVIYPTKSDTPGKNANLSNEKTEVRTEVDKSTIELLDRDTDNSSTWERLKKCLPTGKELFIKNVSEEFTCKGCQNLVHIPITTPCGHNSCLSCLQKIFKAKNFVCPACKRNLGSKYLLLRNNRLRDILLNLFPGYDID